MSNTLECSHGTSGKARAEFLRLCGRERLHKQSRKVVLVMVDDDEDDCILVEAALKEASINCTFRCVQDGLEMMDYLRRDGRYQNTKEFPFPDIVLLDLNMPRLSGREVLKQLKTDPRFSVIPVIILSTSSNADDVKVCYELGANSYVTKRSTFHGLHTAIETLMEYWLVAATLPPKPQT